jgi:nucleotide-binding universal stress UspA family protein
MVTRILVPLDGTQVAEQALDYAMALGRELRARLVLLRAVSVPPDAGQMHGRAGIQPSARVQDLEAEAGAYLQSVARRLMPDAGQDVDVVVKRGPVVDAVVSYADQAGIQLIVMACRSLAERLVRDIRVPVLLVHGVQGQESLLPPVWQRRMLVLLDGSRMAEQILSPATALAKGLKWEVVLFQASIPFLFESSTRAAGRLVHRYLQQLADRLGTEGPAVSVAVRVGPVVDEVVQYTASSAVDLIALCTHGRARMLRLLLGSVAMKLAGDSQTPILLVRARRQQPVWQRAWGARAQGLAPRRTPAQLAAFPGESVRSR